MTVDAASTEALETLWRSRGLSVAALLVKEDGTVSPSDPRAFRSAARKRGSHPLGLTPGDQELRLGEELGRGGMGVVHVAVQRSLRREVAVKGALDSEAGAELVGEAWALAHIAHPNVVPVHALTTIDSAPALVMKRISGTLFSSILNHPEEHQALVGKDPLGFQLRVLIDVVRAIEHAHREGVVHLDLKPANVMVGDFGEVYVLDWGLAARVGEEPAHLGAARDIRAVAGTPDYMAPELALAQGELIDARTDVYLLGAMLCEILSGRPPHRGTHALQRLYRACLGAPPSLPPETPPALAEVVLRATDKDPERRHPSAEAFRKAIEGYLEHQEAEALFDRSEREIQALEAVMAQEPRRRASVHHHFGAARFALREARALFPERAADALHARLHRAMARFALDEGELAVAQAHLDELQGANPELVRELEAARLSEQDRKRHVERLQALGRDSDLEQGRALRGRVIAALALVFLLSNLAMGAVERSGMWAFGYLDMLVSGLIAACVLVPFAILRRAQLFPNRVARSVWGIALGQLAVVQVHWGLCHSIGLPFQTALALTPLHYGLCFGALSVLLDGKLWPAALLQAPTVLLAAMAPSHRYEILGIGGFLSLGWVSLVWGAGDRHAAKRRVRRS